MISVGSRPCLKLHAERTAPFVLKATSETVGVRMTELLTVSGSPVGVGRETDCVDSKGVFCAHLPRVFVRVIDKHDTDEVSC